MSGVLLAGEGVAPELGRRPGRGGRRRRPGHRRTVRRGQGADRRLRDPRGRLARRGRRARPQVRAAGRRRAGRRTPGHRVRRPRPDGRTRPPQQPWTTPTLDQTVATLWRVESPRVIARLARLLGDLDTAEELAQDAFVAAIEKWRADGVPNNPAAWLHTTARFLAVDRIRRRDTQRGKYRLVAAAQPQTLEHDLDEIVDGDLADDLLGLIFMACHPILSPDARSALTLKLVCGLSTEDVARAFLTPAATIAQRIVRAKRTLAAAKVRFELPADPRSARPGSTPYARSSTWCSTRATPPPAVTSGSAATCAPRRSGSAGCWPPDPVRHRDAGAAGADRAPGVAAARPHRPGRRAGAAARPGPHALGPAADPARGLANLDRIERARRHRRPLRPAGGDRRPAMRGPRTAADTDWERITALYDGLAPDQPVAGGRAQPRRRDRAGVRPGGRPRRSCCPLFDVPSMRGYHLLPAVAGDLFCRLR